MRVLQLCNKPPQPKIDGGCIAINNISTGLISENIDLKILTVATDKHPFDELNFSQEFLSKTNIQGVYIDTRINIIDAFSALVTSDSYNVNRFFSADFDKVLTKILQRQKFDIIHLESLFMTPYISTIRRLSKGKIILRSHNLEHLIWERLADSSGNPAKKIYLKHLSSKLKKYETKTINEVDGIATISSEDTKRFVDLDCKIPMITVPFGIDINLYSFQENKTTTPLKLFHLGALNWQPNSEAVNWFLDDMWPTLASDKVEFHLAGRDIPSHIKPNASQNFFVHGDVNNAISFMKDHQVMLVPLLSGSGMRVKIIEGMALGKVVISTSVGAEGIACEHKKNILIADSPEEFIQHIQFLIQHPEQLKEIGNNARKLVESHYDNHKIIKDLISFYQQLLID